MIPLTILYDEYIDRPKLTEQKNPMEYIVPSTTSGVGTVSWKISLPLRNQIKAQVHIEIEDL